MNTDFPRLLYKPDANGEPIWGIGSFALLRAEDQAAQDAALAVGWTLRPDDESVKRKASTKVADVPVAAGG